MTLPTPSGLTSRDEQGIALVTHMAECNDFTKYKQTYNHVQLLATM